MFSEISFLHNKYARTFITFQGNDENVFVRNSRVKTDFSVKCGQMHVKWPIVDEKWTKVSL